jgi:hypothetical protein
MNSIELRRCLESEIDCLRAQRDEAVELLRRFLIACPDMPIKLEDDICTLLAKIDGGE